MFVSFTRVNDGLKFLVIRDIFNVLVLFVIGSRLEKIFENSNKVLYWAETYILRSTENLSRKKYFKINVFLAALRVLNVQRSRWLEKAIVLFGSGCSGGVV